MLTICMIVKDEEPVIEKCLKAIEKLGYDIVIVDTGSTDKTKEIAYKYTDKVYDYKWNDSFSDARNFAIDKTENEFILMIDADEVIIDFNKKEVERLIKLNKNKAGRIFRIDEFNGNGAASKSIEKISRVFSKKYYRYTGSIHEQLTALDGNKNKTYELPIRAIHNGYNEDELSRKDKIKRNITMLKKALESNPQDPYILYQLGKSYYIRKDYEKACEYFHEVMNIDLDVRLEYIQTLIQCYGYSLLNMKKYSQALELASVYDTFGENSDFVFLIGLIYMNNGMFNEAVLEFLKASNMSNATVVGVNDNLSFYNIGVIYECLGQFKEAEEYYLKCKDYKPAIDRLKVIKKSC